MKIAKPILSLFFCLMILGIHTSCHTDLPKTVDEGDDDYSTAIDNDGDGIAPINGDCDDSDATVYPGATEVCDGVDDDCDGEVDEDLPDCDSGGGSDTGGTDTTTEAEIAASYATYFSACDSTLATYGFNTSNTLYVYPSGAAIGASSYTSIASALNSRSSSYLADTDIAIFLAQNTVFPEDVVLNISHTYIIGCNTTSIIQPYPTTVSINTNTVKIGDGTTSGLTNMGLYNLTVQGISDLYSGSDTPSTETATVLINDVSTFSLDNVIIDRNYYQAMAIEDTSSSGTVSGTIQNSQLADITSSSVYNYTIGLWVAAGTVTLDNLSFDNTDYDYSIYNASGNITATNMQIVNDSVSHSGTPQVGMAFDNGSQGTISGVTFFNNEYPLYSQDAANLSVSDYATIDFSNTHGVIACQSSGDFANAGSYITAFNSTNISELTLGKVTASGVDNMITGFYNDNSVIDTSSDLYSLPSSPVTENCDLY